MKVGELVSALTRLDQDLPVLIVSEDEQFAIDGRAFIVLEPESVDVTTAETTRLDDGSPYLRFNKSEHARQIAYINVTANF